MKRSFLRTLLAPLALAGVAPACSMAAPEPGPEPEPAIRLTATLVSPDDVELRWTPGAPGAAGRIVEFATDPAGEYTTLQFLPPAADRFTHPDLMPDTTFYYRVRAYYGPATGAVQVVLPEPPAGEDVEQDDHAWARPRTIAPGPPATKRPIRRRPADGAPTRLTATVMHSMGILFTWSDRASDEDGYLLEVKPAGERDYAVAAILDPDVDSFGLITLANERTASFRVRAFYYGRPSNLAQATTGPEPPPRR